MRKHKTQKHNDEQMTKPFVPNIRLLSRVDHIQDVNRYCQTCFCNKYSVEIESPWIGNCTLFVKPRLENPCNVLQFQKGKTSEQAIRYLLET